MEETYVTVEEAPTYVTVDDRTITVPEQVIDVVEIAIEGPPGQPGPQGPPGDIVTLADAHYNHSQVIPSKVWTITHNLGKVPAVTVVDSGGNEVEGQVRHLSQNASEITFSAEFSGNAYLS